MSDYRLSEEIRNFIIQEKIRNTPPSNIQAELLRIFRRSVSLSTIRNTWRRYQETGSIRYQTPAGRPRALTARQERSLVRNFSTTPGLSIRYVIGNQDRNPIAQRPISRRTLRRRLRRNGLRPRTTRQGMEVSLRNRDKRVKYAQDHLHWTESDWGRVVFTDECKLFPKRTVTSVSWTNPQNPGPIPLEENLERFGVNVWGFCRYDGTVGLVRFEGTMDQDKYLEILEDNIEEAMAPMRGRRGQLIFMHDNASFHTANSVRNWLAQNVNNILAFPPQSPDLSPIENIWSVIQNELWNRREQIRGPNDVWAFSREIVRNLTLVYIRSLYESLPRRLASVIRNRGNRYRH